MNDPMSEPDHLEVRQLFHAIDRLRVPACTAVAAAVFIAARASASLTLAAQDSLAVDCCWTGRKLTQMAKRQSKKPNKQEARSGSQPIEPRERGSCWSARADSESAPRQRNPAIST
jgi:hypothetical protein